MVKIYMELNEKRLYTMCVLYTLLIACISGAAIYFMSKSNDIALCIKENTANSYEICGDSSFLLLLSSFLTIVVIIVHLQFICVACFSFKCTCHKKSAKLQIIKDMTPESQNLDPST